MSCYLRISRLTLPDELNGLQFYHPYGIWLNEEHALVHHNALLLPMNTPIIQYVHSNIYSGIDRAIIYF